MATIIIPRPTPTRPTFNNYTPGSDFIRGSGNDELLGYALSGFEQSFLDFLEGLGATQNQARDVFFLGNGPAFGGPVPDQSVFLGNDRIYARGGDDYVVDLQGDNFVVTEEGNDRILLGFGNDRIYDQGGDNDIDILGGNNTVTTRDGDDNIETGDGNDNINAFDGRNFINAADGNNIVRGGDDFDEVHIGLGDDFVDIRGGFLGEDVNGNGVLDSDPFEDRNFNGILDGPDVMQVFFGEPFAGLTVGPAFYHNVVIDNGGSDNIRSTASGSRQGDDFVLSDVIVSRDDTSVPGVTQFILETVVNIGNDTIELGAGNNFIFDTGGDTTVRTLQGNDTIYTSYFFTGDDNIDSGAGSDLVNPGLGSDIVRPGPGDDFIVLENDGDADTIRYVPGTTISGVYIPGDEVPAAAGNVGFVDIAFGFDLAGGVDKIDVSPFDVDIADLFLFDAGAFGISAGGNVGTDLLVGFQSDTIGPFFTTILADALQLPTADNFIFGDAMA